MAHKSLRYYSWDSSWESLGFQCPTHSNALGWAFVLNPIFHDHDHAKHIDAGCHFSWEKIENDCIYTSFIRSKEHLEDVFLKELPIKDMMRSILANVGMIDIGALTFFFFSVGGLERGSFFIL